MTEAELQTKLRTAVVDDGTDPPTESVDTSDDPWRVYADYLHETTVLSPRQAEVVALERFGHSASDIADALDISASARSKHWSAITEKTQHATALSLLQSSPLRGVGVAPVEVASATVEGPQGGEYHNFHLYVNYAYGARLLDESNPAANARLALVRESLTEGVRNSNRTFEVSLFKDYDEFVLAGFATRVFPAPTEACVERVAKMSSTLSGRPSEQLLERRNSVYDGIESSYLAVTRGEATVESIADTYGIHPSHVSRNVRELTTTH